MSDPIDRQTALATYQQRVCFGTSCKDCPFLFRVSQTATDCKLESFIRELPSAQPEIIRCKDCKYYVIHTLFGRSQGWCERLCDAFDRSRPMATELDDYCSRAERKTDG